MIADLDSGLVIRIYRETNRHKWNACTPIDERKLRDLGCPSRFSDCNLDIVRGKAAGEGFTIEQVASAPSLAHALTECEKDRRTAQYSYRNHSIEFGCPICGRRGRYNLNFLGRQLVHCDGERFVKVAR